MPRGNLIFGRTGLWAVALLAALTLLYWKVRITDLAVNDTPSFYSGDMYNQHHPMTEYGFASLRAGGIPLWNPYQLCGEPLLATSPYIGLFYPLNFPHLLFDTGVATEVHLILHMFLGAVGMWCLMRRFGVGALGALCSAVTFVWCGWLIFNVNHPALYGGMAWMPVTVLLVELAAAGRWWAPLGLAAAVGSQILMFGGEILLHSMYAATVFGMARLGWIAWQGQWAMALRNGLTIVAGVVAGLGLGAVQILPVAELLRLSARAPGTLTFEQVAAVAVGVREFMVASLEVPRFLQLVPLITLGALPVVAPMLLLGYRQHRLLWTSALVVAAFGLLLAFGEGFFRLYYEVFPPGRVFRRPVKFLSLYSFGQAILAGVAIVRLESWVTLPRRRVWLHTGWLAALAVGVAATGWAVTQLERPSPYLAALLGLMVLFAAFDSVPWRRAVLLGLCLLQASSLFFTTGTYDIRPWRQPEVLTRYEDVLASLRERAGHHRSYVYGLMGPSATAVKWWIRIKGLRDRVYLVTDYEALVAGRYGTFFDYVAPRLQKTPFIGMYHVGRRARWRMMNLTGTKYFVAYRGSLADGFMVRSVMSPGGPRFRLVEDGTIRIYEKTDGVLPRAYFVPGARVLSDPAEVLERLDDPNFDPRQEVIFEQQPHERIAVKPGAVNRVDIVGYEPERVSLTVTTDAPGYLVLSDLFYPGWKAFVDDREVPIYQANYLFRAVPIEAGSWFVRFEYHPASFRTGARISVATLVVVVGLAIHGLRRRKRPE